MPTQRRNWGKTSTLSEEQIRGLNSLWEEGKFLAADLCQRFEISYSTFLKHTTSRRKVWHHYDEELAALIVFRHLKGWTKRDFESIMGIKYEGHVKRALAEVGLTPRKSGRPPRCSESQEKISSPESSSATVLATVAPQSSALSTECPNVKSNPIVKSEVGHGN